MAATTRMDDRGGLYQQRERLIMGLIPIKEIFPKGSGGQKSNGTSKTPPKKNPKKT